MVKKILLAGILAVVLCYGLCELGLYIVGRCSKPNTEYLQAAAEVESPNTNFLFASNATLVGRIYMTLTDGHLPCINTATSFYNKYHTCSNCVDFEKNPGKWGFKKVDSPQVGDMLIQHKADTGRAYHAAVIVDIRGGNYYISHAVKTKYIKNQRLKSKARLTFYRFVAE